MIFIILTLALSISACTGPGASTGLAPGVLIIDPGTIPTSTSNNQIKNGESITTSNGWQVASDNTDPVEHKDLSNGWKVEVKYE